MSELQVSVVHLVIPLKRYAASQSPSKGKQKRREEEEEGGFFPGFTLRVCKIFITGVEYHCGVYIHLSLSRTI